MKKSKLHRLSKWFHKYIGLTLLVFIIWMSVSGIALNHPELMEGISAPAWMVPPSYYPEDWSLSALISGVQLGDGDESIVIAGKKGVWISRDAGASFEPWEQGLPDGDYNSKAYTLLEYNETLLLGREDGLYKRQVGAAGWQPVVLPDSKRPVKKIFQTAENSIIAVTDSEVFSSDSSLQFSKYDLRLAEEKSEVSLVTLFFDIHSGKVWGLPGRLLYDLAGGVSVFLCVTAFYIWYFPWRRKKRKQHDTAKEKKENRSYNWHVKRHNNWGIWFAALLIIISFTGIFMRPPLLAIIANGEVDRIFYPGLLPDNPFYKKLQNAVYDPETDTVLLATSDGFYRTDADFSTPLESVPNPAPVFVMGATVLEYDEDRLIVGSFNGLFSAGREPAIDMLSGEEAGKVSNVKPAEVMITGMLELNHGRRVYSSHENGLVFARGDDQFELNMPEELRRNPRMPLWNWFFELHNGRIFQDLIGNFYILLVPLGSTLFFLLTVSGVYLWFVRDKRRKGV